MDQRNEDENRGSRQQRSRRFHQRIFRVDQYSEGNPILPLFLVVFQKSSKGSMNLILDLKRNTGCSRTFQILDRGQKRRSESVVKERTHHTTRDGVGMVGSPTRSLVVRTKTETWKQERRRRRLPQCRVGERGKSREKCTVENKIDQNRFCRR